MTSWKPNLEETKKRYVDWWNHKGIVLNMWEHFQEGVTPHADVPLPPPPRDLNQRWFDPQWRADYLDWYVAHSSLMADMLPVANTQLGPGSLAAILGGVFEGGEDTIWIHPDPHFTDAIRFDPQHPNYVLHKELLRACKHKAQGHYYVGMPDLMEGLDVLAALKGTDKVLMDTVMQPEVVERQMQQINDIYFQVFDELYDIIREGDEMAFCYFSAWAPGKMTKLQSDISTMISDDDYRRFVQPFIREQCQKIPYTLYHLDGVGAMHHLPALLEIEELNAIQWTPGVGQPQGGSPKWYDLYRRILAAGKSIMACWVTLDELRPLLDAIGGDGVHLEMDFHNEREVEQAMRIVEEYQSLIPSSSPNEREIVRLDGGELTDEEADHEVLRIIETVESSDKTDHAPLPSGRTEGGLPGDRLLVLDGAMGTMIQQYGLREEDFRGARFANHDRPLKGCNDVLSLTCSFIVSDIHRKYLEAGADIIETNTFNAQRISMADYGLQEHCRDINLAATRLARKCADAYSTSDKPRYVLGSIGPTSRTCSFATGSGAPLSTSLLHDAYLEQASALLEGGVDGLLIETIFDTLNAKVAIEAAREAMRQQERDVPLLLSFNVTTPDGHNMLGQSILEFLEDITHHFAPIFSVGINCVSDVQQMTPLVHELARFGCGVSLYPNAGMPDANGQYSKTPESLLADLWPLLEGHHLTIIGGCCGTTDAHIRLMAKAVEPVPGIRLSPKNTNEPTTTKPTTKPTPNPSPREGSLDSASASHPAPTSRHDSNQAPLPWGGAGGGFATSRHDSNQAPLPWGGVGGGFTPSNQALLPWGGAGGGFGGGGVAGVEFSLFTAILSGNSADAVSATKEAIAAGAKPQELINGEMIRAMGEVGQRFQDGKAFVPQLLMAGRAMKAALEELKPLMAGTTTMAIGKVVIGTVKGDLHDIGKNLVASMLEGCGFEVVNIGIDVSADAFIEAVRQHQPDILCMSALLTTTMGYMKQVIDALQAAGIRDRVKVMVGGAPVTQGFADEIGADGYSDNANTAVTVAKQLLGKGTDR